MDRTWKSVSKIALGGRYKDEGGMKGEEEVGRCERGGTCHNDKPGLRGGVDTGPQLPGCSEAS